MKEMKGKVVPDAGLDRPLSLQKVEVPRISRQVGTWR
jgi:hypothetical protein